MARNRRKRRTRWFVKPKGGTVLIDHDVARYAPGDEVPVREIRSRDPKLVKRWISAGMLIPEEVFKVQFREQWEKRYGPLPDTSQKQKALLAQRPDDTKQGDQVTEI